MSALTAILSLIKHTDSDTVRSGETTDSSANMDKLDAVLAGTDAYKIPAAALADLPANVNVLGNRTAAGEYVQHGGTASPNANTAGTFVYAATTAITFPVAFVSVPIVLANTQNAEVAAVGVTSINNTGCAFGVIGHTNFVAVKSIGWIALGS